MPFFHSSKSTVAKLCQTHQGAAVIDADALGHRSYTLTPPSFPPSLPPSLPSSLVASGKSTVAKLCQTHQGAAVIDADVLGHRSYAKGTSCFRLLVKTFGEGIMGEDGNINRYVPLPPSLPPSLPAFVWTVL